MTTTLTVCGVCDSTVDLKPCPISDVSSNHDAVLFCSGCLKHCPKCGDDVCHDHFNEKHHTCTACEHQRYVDSGEARDEYRRYGRDDS